MSSQSLSETRSRTLSGATLGFFPGTKKRASSLRQSSKESTANNEVEEVEYLDGKKETGNRLTREGKVRAKYKNGDVYEGYVSTSKDNAFVKSGKGFYQWKSGATYEGWYKNNQKHGKGKYVTKGEVAFDGVFNNGLKEGKGVYTYKDGTTFTGTWKKGKRFGKGKYVYKDGSTQTGEYENGKLLEHTKKITRPLKQIDGPKLVVIGPPASGTAFQAKKISEQLGCLHLMLENLVKESAEEGHDLGKKAQAYEEKGMVIPDEVLAGIISFRLDKDDAREKGFVLDGFPESTTQLRLLKDMGVVIERALCLEVGDEELKGKAAAIPPEEKDRMKFDEKLELHKRNLQGISNILHNDLVMVNGNGSDDETWALMKGEIEKL